MTGPRSIDGPAGDAPARDDRAKVRLNIRAGLAGYIMRIDYADKIGVSMDAPPSSFFHRGLGKLFVHRGTEAPSGMPCYYEVEA